jgi:cell division inhibitor SepF
MGFLDELKKLTRPYDEDEDDYIDDAEVVDQPEADRPRPNPFAGFGGGSAQSAPQSSGPSRPREGKVVNFGPAGGQTQVVLIKPERFETAAEIADHLRAKRPVLINLETTPKEVTRRLVDFLSGVAYAIDGKVKKIAANTYIITPPNVDLVGDLMDELESSGMYF